MSFRHVVADPFGSFTEVIEDQLLAAALERGDDVRFRVTAEEWNEDFTVRTIRQAELVAGR